MVSVCCGNVCGEQLCFASASHSSRGSSGAPGKQHRYNKDHCDSRSSSTKELKDDAQGTAVAVQDNGHRQPLEACNLSNGTLPKQQLLLLLLKQKAPEIVKQQTRNCSNL